jgi:hypothetical protein
MRQILLNAKNCSGRGVRLELLSLADRNQIREEAAKDMTPESTLMEWENRQADMGVRAMVVAITDRTGFKTKAELLAEGVVWKKVSPEDLADKADTFFNPKDLAVLSATFRKLHDVTEKEVEDILGEALDVTAD